MSVKKFRSVFFYYAEVHRNFRTTAPELRMDGSISVLTDLPTSSTESVSEVTKQIKEFVMAEFCKKKEIDSREHVHVVLIKNLSLIHTEEVSE